MRGDENITIQDARLIFRNFTGREDMYNAAGTRNFGLVLSQPELVTAMVEDGWNVKLPKDPEEGRDPYIIVGLKYRARDGRPLTPPRIVLVTKRGRTPLGEDEIEILDYVEIDAVDITIRPNDWAMNGKTGRKAYLKTLFVRMREDPLEEKYAHLPELDRGGAIVQQAIEAAPAYSGETIEGEWH